MLSRRHFLIASTATPMTGVCLELSELGIFRTPKHLSIAAAFSGTKYGTEPLAATKLHVYENLTTTPVELFSDTNLRIPFENPVVANAAGTFPDVYVPPGLYTLRVTDSSGALIVESDNNEVGDTDPGEIVVKKFLTVAELLTDLTMGYTTGGSVTQVVAAGEVVEAGDFRYTILDSADTDPHVTTAGGVELDVRGVGGVYILNAWGVVDGSDITTALASALPVADTLVITEGDYTVTGNTETTMGRVIKGTGDVTITTSSDDFILTFTGFATSADEHFKLATLIENIQLVGKNCLEINPTVTTEADLVAQRGFKITRCSMTGTYDINADLLAGNESTFPTKNELTALGVGVSTKKVYGLDIDNCNIQNFGIGFLSEGDVAGKCHTSRTRNSAVNIWRGTADSKVNLPFGTDFTFGPSLDILNSGRMGSITIFDTRHDKVFGNFFENKDETTPSMMIRVENTQGTKITQNHLNPSAKIGTNGTFLRLKSDYNTIVKDNSIQDHPTTLEYKIQVIESYNQNYGAVQAIFSDNTLFPIVDQPHVLNGPYDPAVFSYDNLCPSVDYIRGTVTNNQTIFQDSSNTGNKILKQSNLSGDARVSCVFDLTAVNRGGWNSLEIDIEGGYGKGFMAVTDSFGNSLWSGEIMNGFVARSGRKKLFLDLLELLSTPSTFTFTLYTHNYEWSRIAIKFGPRTFGTTAQRPDANSVETGFSYYDEDLGRLIFSSGLDWRNSDGSFV